MDKDLNSYQNKIDPQTARYRSEIQCQQLLGQNF